MNANKIRIAIADDSKFSLESLNEIIPALGDYEVVLSANNSEALLNQLATILVDLIILDYRMPPGKNGQEISKIIKSKYEDIKILIFSGYDELKIVEACLGAGVDGYLLKGEVGVDDLREAINCATNNKTYFSKTILDKIVTHFGPKDKIKKAGDLTPTEVQILLLICEQFTTKEIAKKLFRSINTVETHRKNILGKTDCKNSVGLALWAVKQGLLPGFE